MRKVLSFITLFCVLFVQAHNIYTIYPIPQEQFEIEGKASFSKHVNIVVENNIDDITINRAKQVLTEAGLTPIISQKIAKNQTNLLLGINNSNGIADKHVSSLKLNREVFTLNKYDRHIINLSADNKGIAQVTIVGENTDAVFCALASMEQIFDCGTTDLQCVTIYDYADIKNRGIIEGYYGVPYTAEVTKDLFRFMARYKMNTYMYGAKSDSYHSQFWSDPYPTSITEEQLRIGYLTQDMMKDITATAHDTKVNFIWAIHPGKTFADPKNTDVLDKIMTKFESMYGLGVRQFGVFVDDVGVPSETEIMDLCSKNITDLQHRIDNRWNIEGAAPADTVKPLHYVPQLYAFSWATPEKTKTFFESLKSTPSKLNIYITGRNVWSVPNNEDIAIIKEHLGRDVSWWWNYPCNDEDHTKLFIMDTYTNFIDESHIDNLARLESGINGANSIIVNPMQQGALAKIALFSVADYTWNCGAFNNQRSWEASLPAVVGEKYAKALKKAAPFLRYYDTDALAYLIMRYKLSIKRGKPNHEALLNELREVNKACEVLKTMKDSNNESDKLFYNDLRPWLLKLADMTGEAVALFEGKNPPAIDYENNPEYQFDILGGMGAHISLKVKKAEPSAQCLPEFIKWLREQETIK